MLGGMNNTGKWILGILAGFFGLALLFFAFTLFMVTTTVTTQTSDTYEESYGSGSERVAIVEIDGPIVSSDEIVRKLQKYRKRGSVKAIVIRLDSPGGGVVPSHEIYEEVRRTSSRGIPVVISMGSVAASGAYYIACGADLIVSNPGSITGSIGVISAFTNLQELLGKIGVQRTTIASGKFKDTGDPSRAMREDEVAQIRETIMNVHRQFVDIVVRGRKNMSRDSIEALADGRIFSGEQAYLLGLVDTLGTLETAVSIAGTLGKIEGEPRVVRERSREPFIDRILGNGASTTFQQMRERLSAEAPLEYRMNIDASPQF